jgi:hypothetical protein
MMATKSWKAAGRFTFTSDHPIELLKAAESYWATGPHWAHEIVTVQKTTG